MAGVYWIGQDGNTWMKGDATGDTRKWSAPLQTPEQLGYTLINDPVNPSAGPAPSGGGGGGAAAPVFNQAAAENTQRTIDQIPGILQAALAAELQKYQNAVNVFGAQEQQQRKTYDESTTTNQLNYDENFMDSIRAGVKGLGGLMQILRGTGAGGGTAEEQVRDVVGGVTSNDIRTGADTRNENQGQLDTTLSSFLTDLGLKRKQNEDTRVNNERAVRRDASTQLQDLYGKMAGFYGDAGRTAEANTWMSRAGSLTPEIAANSATQVSAYDTAPIAVKAPEIAAFSAPSQPNVVTAPSDGQIGAGLFAISNRRRDKQPAVAGV